jgi:hypothetical protein
MITEEQVLKSLDKPRSLYSVLQVVNPSGSQEELHTLLMRMRDAGKVKFDIHKGRWAKA